jgi:hypothetical protein
VSWSRSGQARVRRCGSSLDRTPMTPDGSDSSAAAPSRRSARLHPTARHSGATADADSQCVTHVRDPPASGRRADPVRQSATGASRCLDHVAGLSALVAPCVTSGGRSARCAATISNPRATGGGFRRSGDHAESFGMNGKPNVRQLEPRRPLVGALDELRCAA